MPASGSVGGDDMPTGPESNASRPISLHRGSGPNYEDGVVITCGRFQLHLVHCLAEKHSVRSARIHDVPTRVDDASGNRERQ